MPCVGKQKTTGKPCPNPPLDGREYCYHHDPELKAQRRSAARRRVTGVLQVPTDLMTLEGQQKHLAAIVRELETDADMAPPRARAIIHGLETLMRMTLLLEERDRERQRLEQLLRQPKNDAPEPEPTPAAPAPPEPPRVPTLAEIIARGAN